MGAPRAKFLLESIEDLRKRLRDAGHELLIRRGNTANVFQELCNDFNVEGCYCFNEVCSEELRVEAQVRNVLKKHGAELRSFWGFELYNIKDLPFDPWRKCPQTYSSFRRGSRSLAIFARKCLSNSLLFLL